jgi:Domain of unknown function (DUF4340)
MSSKQLLRLAAVLAAVLLLWGAVALASKRTEEKTDLANILPKLDTAVIDTIAITGPNDTAILVRTRGAAGWQVNGHPTDPQAVSELLKGLADTEQTPELVAKSKSSHARLRVSEDSGRRVRLISHGRTLGELIAGKQTIETDGIYLRRPGGQEVYLLRSGLATALNRSSQEWRNHAIAEVTPDSVGAIQISRGGKSYSLRRRGMNWVFASGAPVDSARVAELLSSYRQVKASGFSDNAQQDSLRNVKPRRTARLLDQQGSPLLSLVFDSTASGFWVRVNPGTAAATTGEAYRLESWTADQLTPPDSTLRKH